MARVGSRTAAEPGSEGSGAGNDIGENVVDPRSIDGATGGGSEGDSEGSQEGSAGSPARKPRSDKGQKRGPRENKTVPVNLAAISAQLMAIHATLAIATTSPEWNMEEKEAELITSTFTNASRHYITIASEQTRDTWAAIMVIGVAYGSRIIAINRRKSRERQMRRETGQPSVVVQPPGKPTQKGNSATSGAPPVTRPKTEADNALLDEIIQPVFN